MRSTITEQHVVDAIVAAERFTRELDLLGTQVAAADPIAAYLSSARAGQRLILESLQELQRAARGVEARA
jgi:hypothetical protein